MRCARRVDTLGAAGGIRVTRLDGAREGDDRAEVGGHTPGVRQACAEIETALVGRTRQTVAPVRARHLLIAVAAGLALADASIVTLALPDILVDLHTTVDGVAAVIGVYTVVLVVTLIPAERVMRRIGPARAGAAGLALFAVASLACAAAELARPSCWSRAPSRRSADPAALMAAFSLLVAKRDARQLWLYATVVASAVGPALGGALTQAFDWRAIFIFQAPIGAIAAVACLLERDVVIPPRVEREPFRVCRQPRSRCSRPRSAPCSSCSS